MSIIATQKLFFTHAWETYLIGGLLIFLIGLLLGRALWQHCQSQADRVEALNKTLEERKDVLNEKNQQLASLLEELSEKSHS